MLEFPNRLGTKSACECETGGDSRVMVAALIVKSFELHRDAYTSLSVP